MQVQGQYDDVQPQSARYSVKSALLTSLALLVICTLITGLLLLVQAHTVDDSDSRWAQLMIGERGRRGGVISLDRWEYFIVEGHT